MNETKYIITEKQIKKLEDVLREERVRASQEGYPKGYQDGQMEKEIELHDRKIEEAYQRGLNDAWECAKMIVNREDAMRCLFNDLSPGEIIRKYSAADVIKKCKEICNANDNIKAGDEIKTIINGKEYRILVTGEDKIYYYGIGMVSNNIGAISNKTANIDKRDKNIVKTGRHFPELIELLKKMGRMDDKRTVYMQSIKGVG